MPTMPIPGVPGAPEKETAYVKQLAEVLARYMKDNAWIVNGNMDSKNAREFGGWLVKLDQLVSKDGDVGMSTIDTAEDDIRFFAGPDGSDGYLFYVTKGGYAEMQNANVRGTIEALAGHIGGFTIEADKLSSDSGEGIIEGGTLRTGPDGEARIEISDNTLKTYNTDGNLQGPVWGESVPSSAYGDLSLYDDGTEVVRFENQLAGNGYLIKSVGGISSLRLGGVGRNTQATGTWRFYGNTTFDFDITGKIAEAYYADNAGVASSADSLAPSGNIAWGQVLKTGSNVTDLAIKNLSSMTDDSTHRTVTDTQIAAWNQSTNKTAISAYAATTQAIASGSWVTIIFGTEENDALNEFVPATSVFTASRAGTYLITVMANWVSLTAGTRALVRAYANSSAEYWIDDKIASATGQTAIGGSMQINLNIGDTIVIQALVGASSTLAAQYTRASISRVV